MGLEVSGLVSSVGSNASLKVGDRVCALVHGGGYATEAIARSDFCLKLDDSISLELGAALPEALLTVWYNLIERAQLKPKEPVGPWWRQRYWQHRYSARDPDGLRGNSDGWK